jgi:hypothetical protein
MFLNPAVDPGECRQPPGSVKVAARCSSAAFIPTV